MYLPSMTGTTLEFH